MEELKNVDDKVAKILILILILKNKKMIIKEEAVEMKSKTCYQYKLAPWFSLHHQDFNTTFV